MKPDDLPLSIMMDPEDFSIGPALAFPCAITSLDYKDGRIIVGLADGRVIDATDWFAHDCPDGAAN